MPGNGLTLKRLLRVCPIITPLDLSLPRFSRVALGVFARCPRYRPDDVSDEVPPIDRRAFSALFRLVLGVCRKLRGYDCFDRSAVCVKLASDPGDSVLGFLIS